MEISGSVIVFLLGLVLTLLSANDIWNRFSWGYASKSDPLPLLIVALIAGLYLLYLPFS